MPLLSRNRLDCFASGGVRVLAAEFCFEAVDQRYEHLRFDTALLEQRDRAGRSRRMFAKDEPRVDDCRVVVEGERWEGVEGKERDLECLVSGEGFSAPDTPGIGDEHHRVFGRAPHADPHVDTRLFAYLATCGLGEDFARVDEPGWERPAS